MNAKPEYVEPGYLPVAWEYREEIEEQIAKKKTGKIFFFGKKGDICEEEGPITKMEEVAKKGVFITVNKDHKVRVDRIITLFGVPGAAYDEYDAYSNACMNCSGGYDKDELKGYSI